jgi:UDP-N-acetyl-D-glucosamine dehydrogenase
VKTAVTRRNYVGLPLVAEFARAGFRVTGFDKDERKVVALNKGESYIQDVPVEDIAPHVREGRLDASTDPAVLGKADAIIVCVPTPLNKTKDPDMRFIVDVTAEIARHQHAGMVIVLESTTYPGTTTEVLVPKLKAERCGPGGRVSRREPDPTTRLGRRTLT